MSLDKRFTDSELNSAITGAGMSSTQGRTYKELRAIRDARPVIQEAIEEINEILGRYDHQDLGPGRHAFSYGLEIAIALLERKARLPEGGEA